MEIYLIISLTCPMRSFYIPAMTNSDFMELIDNFFLVVYKSVSMFQGSNVFILNNCSLFVYGSKRVWLCPLVSARCHATKVPHPDSFWIYQSIDLHSKPMDWFPYDRDLRHQTVKRSSEIFLFFFF